MERHLRKLRKLYGAKSERLIWALQSAFGSQIKITLQETPLILLLDVHTDKSAEELCRMALQKGIRVLPGNGGKIRMGFAGIPLEEIEDAVACLKSAWKNI